MSQPWMNAQQPIAARVQALLAEMTLSEKVGQLNQIPPNHTSHELVQQGMVGSTILASSAWAGNEQQTAVRAQAVDALQRVAVEESRLGIPIIFGRDVIHGHSTVFPIPLGQGATWDADMVEEGCRISAAECSADGVRWTFSPMLDIARDPRWGRIAEGYGEAPYLTSVLGVAAVRGYQGADPAQPGRIAACAKHFVGYGAAAGGRDYDSTELSPTALDDVYLPPFQAAVEAGCLTIMSSFNEIEGLPLCAHEELLSGVLRGRWGFDGFVVTDWNAVQELQNHGVAGDGPDAVRQALIAGADMDMVCRLYEKHLAAEVEAGRIDMALVDQAVARVLSVKFRLGLFERPYVGDAGEDIQACAEHRAAARRAAVASLTLLHNTQQLLPLGAQRRVAVVGPLAHAASECFGTWTLDGRADLAISIADAMAAAAPEGVRVHSAGAGLYDMMQHQVRQSDAAVVVVGEGPSRSGEANSVADIGLPPGQRELVLALARLGTPMVLVVLSGRPLALGEDVVAACDAILAAWHPGLEGPAAIAEVLFGLHEPGGRTPVTWPRSTGQIPIHHDQKPTGRPLDEYRLGDERFYRQLDQNGRPQFPFGYGLGYTQWEYSAVEAAGHSSLADGLRVKVTVRNSGGRRGGTVAQCYIRQPVAERSQPQRRLVAFQRVELEAGAETELHFHIPTCELAYRHRDGSRRSDAAMFQVWIHGDSVSGEALDVQLMP